MDAETYPNDDPETTDVRNLTYPPDDLPSEPAAIRPDGAIRRWNGYLWRWSEQSGWRYVGL
jgi:hypothetical protein